MTELLDGGKSTSGGREEKYVCRCVYIRGNDTRGVGLEIAWLFQPGAGVMHLLTELLHNEVDVPASEERVRGGVLLEHRGTVLKNVLEPRRGVLGQRRDILEHLRDILGNQQEVLEHRREVLATVSGRPSYIGERTYLVVDYAVMHRDVIRHDVISDVACLQSKA